MHRRNYCLEQPRDSWSIVETPRSPGVAAGTVAGVGTLLLTKYLLPFESISLLLLGALIGAALLSRKEN